MVVNRSCRRLPAASSTTRNSTNQPNPQGHVSRSKKRLQEADRNGCLLGSRLHNHNRFSSRRRGLSLPLLSPAASPASWGSLSCMSSSLNHEPPSAHSQLPLFRGPEWVSVGASTSHYLYPKQKNPHMKNLQSRTSSTRNLHWYSNRGISLYTLPTTGRARASLSKGYQDH